MGDPAPKRTLRGDPGCLIPRSRCRRTETYRPRHEGPVGWARAGSARMCRSRMLLSQAGPIRFGRDFLGASVAHAIRAETVVARALPRRRLARTLMPSRTDVETR